MNRTIKTLLSLTLLFAMALSALPARAGDAPLPFAGQLPEAAEIVVTAPPQEGSEGDLATFRLREAVYDGEYAYMIVDVTPREGLLLYGPSSGPKDPMSDLTGDGSIPMTIDEYAGKNGLQMASVAVSTALEALGEAFISSIECHMEADGTLVLMLTCKVDGNDGAALAGTLQCSVSPLIPSANEDDAIPYVYFDGDGDEPIYASTGYALDQENRQETELAFTLADAGGYDALTSAQSAEYPSCGVRVDSVNLTASPMALHYKVRFTVTDKTAYTATEDGVWFEFLDENGDALATMSANITQLEDGSLVQSGSLAAQSELPKTAILRAYNCWTKERYETNELTLEP